MKRIKRRANAALLIAALVIAGLGVYISRYVSSGEKWATFVANEDVYVNGALARGTVTDRNDVVLASSESGSYSYAEDSDVRKSCLHVAGDYGGNIGTGALTVFSSRLMGYSLIDGVYSRTGNGGKVQLSIDSSLNSVAYNALSGKKGSVIMMNYKTGEILCMVSSPSYDPLNVPDLTSSSYEGVYLNRTISSTYTPGSIYKIITLTAALENIGDISERRFSCSGSVKVGNDTITCTGNHGSQTIEQAFANSCNCAFAEISLELGADTIAEYAAKYGITQSQSLDGIATAAGNYDKDDTGSSYLAWSGIGQYTDLVSPFSMLRVVSAVANGGSLATPTILLDGNGGSEKILSSSTADSVKAMMANNVASNYGKSRFPGLNICAKTGTAEVGDGTSHSWFVAFLDDEEHPYAIVAMAERAGAGITTAGAIANTVLQAAVGGE